MFNIMMMPQRMMLQSFEMWSKVMSVWMGQAVRSPEGDACTSSGSGDLPPPMAETSKTAV